MEDSGKNRTVGRAASRIIKALASESPAALTRDELLDSESLSLAHGKPHGTTLAGKEREAAAKQLGRMISKKDGDISPLREVLVLASLAPEMPAKETGLVGIKVSLTQIRESAKNGNADNPKSQEEIIDKILDNTKKWINNISDDMPSVILNSVYIIHGDSNYDMIAFLNYNNTDTYMKYIRDVIQSIDGIDRTNTMQVAHGIDGTPLFW